MPGGRIAQYQKKEEIIPFIEEYFTSETTYTVPGLAYACGFNSRQQLWEYGQKDEFTDTIKRALLRIETQRSKNLIDSPIATAGKIFDLKNNFGWQDKKEIELGNKPGEDFSVAGVLHSLETAPKSADNMIKTDQDTQSNQPVKKAKKKRKRQKFT